MKKISLIAAAFLFAFSSMAHTWTSDKAHSKLGFTITHMMISEVEGSFKDFEAKINASKADLSDAVFELNADVNSINTDNDKRDAHLKSADFFDAQKFPSLSFKSTSFRKVSGKNYKLKGNLTIHGITKPVTLDVVMMGPIVHPMSKKNVAGFKITGKINRKDFGIGASMGSSMLSEDVELLANGEFVEG